MPLRKNKVIGSAGIYQIEATNGKKYIGSAVHLSKRVFQGHLNGLIRGDHGNGKLQNHFNKYGINDMWFDIIEFVHKEKKETIEEYKIRLLSREQHYIDTLKPEFNICPIAGSSLGICRSKETREKIGKAHLGIHHSKEANEKMSILMIELCKNPKIKKRLHKQAIEIWNDPEQIENKRESMKIFCNSPKGINHIQELAEKLKCPYCKKEISLGNFVRWHKNNCLYRPKMKRTA